MTVSKTTTITVDDSNGVLRMTFSLPQGAAIPGGIVVEYAPRSGTSAPVPALDITTALAGVTVGGNAVTPAVFATVLAQIRTNILAANGYA